MIVFELFSPQIWSRYPRISGGTKSSFFTNWKESLTNLDSSKFSSADTLPGAVTVRVASLSAFAHGPEAVVNVES